MHVNSNHLLTSISGTHVLAGLELLLPDLVDETLVDVEALKALFPEVRQVPHLDHSCVCSCVSRALECSTSC